MISTGAFLNEMDASNKQHTVAEKFAAAWEKKNAKAARAGGVSLMALSLAACGSSSTTTSSTTSTTTTTTTTAADTIALTAGMDTATGGAGDTTINALTDGHLEASDTITGGLGTDTLVIRDYDTSAGTFTMSGVENININFATTGTTLDLEDVTDLTSVTVDASVATVTVANAEDTHALTLANIASGVTTINVDFEDGEFDGTNTYSLTLNDVDDDLSLSLDTFGASAEAMETLTIDTGSNKNDGTITLTTEGANAETVTITGSAAAKFSGLTSGTVNASGATGNITLNMSAEETTITGGAGDDYINMAGTLTYEDTIDGGAGTNTLGLSTASGAMIDDDATTGNAVNVSNIQTLRLTAELTAPATIDMSDITGLTTIDYDDFGDSGAADAHVITKMPDGAKVIIGDANDNHDAAAESDATLTIGFAANSSSNNMTLELEGAAIAGLVSSDNFIDTLAIESNDDASANGDKNIIEAISSFTAKTITATGAIELDLNDGALSTSTTTVDASGMTGALRVTASATATEITGGSAADTLTGGGSADIISGGAGADTIMGEDGADTLTGGAGSDMFVIDDDDSVDSILDFATGATGDDIDIDISAINTEISGNLIDSAGDVATNANDDFVIADYTSGTALAAASIAATANLIKVAYSASIDAFSDVALSTGNITLDAKAAGNTDAIMFMFYDADGGFANVGYLNDTDADATATAGVYDGTNTTFTSLVTMTMSSADYTSLVAGNFDFV